MVLLSAADSSETVQFRQIGSRRLGFGFGADSTAGMAVSSPAAAPRTAGGPGNRSATLLRDAVGKGTAVMNHLYAHELEHRKVRVRCPIAAGPCHRTAQRVMSPAIGWSAQPAA